MAEKSFYLKPTANVSSNHLRSDTSRSAYSLVQEEDTGYIYQQLTGEEQSYETVKSSFKFIGTLPEDVKVISGINFIIDENPKGCYLDIDSFYTITIKFDNEIVSTKSFSYQGEIEYSHYGASCIGYFEGNSTDEPIYMVVLPEYKPFTLETIDEKLFSQIQFNFDNLSGELNTYLNSKKKLPNIVVEIEFSCNSAKEPDQQIFILKDTDYEVSINKASLEIIYNSDCSWIGFHEEPHKIKDAFIKKEKEWEKIDIEELLQNIKSSKYIYNFMNDKNLKHPMLLPRKQWQHFWNHNINRIIIKDSHIPDGTEIRTWPADITQQGKITCYEYETEIIISGDGSGGIYLHPNSQEIFSNSLPLNPVTVIGLGILKTYSWTNLKFFLMNSIVDVEDDDIDLREWYISNLEGAFMGMQTINGSVYSTVYLPSSIEELPKNTFYRSTILAVDGDGIKKIQDNCFRMGACSLTGQKGGQIVKYVGKMAYYGATSLMGLPLSEGTVIIDDYAYAALGKTGSDDNFADFSIPSTVKYIGVGAFTGAKLTGTLTIPDTVETIGKGAFSHNNITGTLVWPSKCEYIPDRALEATDISEIIIPETVKSIGARALASSDITELNIGKNIQHIGSGFIRSVSNLIVNIDPANSYYYKAEGCIINSKGKIVGSDATFSGSLPSGVRIIGSESLDDISVEKITIPKSIVSIENSGISPKTIKEYTFEGGTPPRLGEYALNSGTDIIIKVPSAALDTYKKAPTWQDYVDQLVGY